MVFYQHDDTPERQAFEQYRSSPDTLGPNAQEKVSSAACFLAMNAYRDQVARFGPPPSYAEAKESISDFASYHADSLLAASQHRITPQESSRVRTTAQTKARFALEDSGCFPSSPNRDNTYASRSQGYGSVCAGGPGPFDDEREEERWNYRSAVGPEGARGGGYRDEDCPPYEYKPDPRRGIDVLSASYENGASGRSNMDYIAGSRSMGEGGMVIRPRQIQMDAPPFRQAPNQNAYDYDSNNQRRLGNNNNGPPPQAVYRSTGPQQGYNSNNNNYIPTQYQNQNQNQGQNPVDQLSGRQGLMIGGLGGLAAGGIGGFLLGKHSSGESSGGTRRERRKERRSNRK